LNPGVEIGGELHIPKATEGILGRIAAQLAKQVIFQKVSGGRTRYRLITNLFRESNEVVNATVKRIEGPDIISTSAKANRACRGKSSSASNRSP